MYMHVRSEKYTIYKTVLKYGKVFLWSFDKWVKLLEKFKWLEKKETNKSRGSSTLNKPNPDQHFISPLHTLKRL